MDEDKMIQRRTWEEFKDNKLLWFINSILHLFGWAIVLEWEDGEEIIAYPARVKYRGFTPESNTSGYIGLTKWLSENCEELLKEAES